MSMFDTLTVADDAPIDDEICQHNWQCNQESIGTNLRVNADGELEMLINSLREGVELDDGENPTRDQVTGEWVMMDNFSQPLYLNSKNHNAVLMIWDGVVKDTKIEEINYDEIQNDIVV